MLKSDLRFVPVLGWSWWLVEYIFLRRDWENDRAHMVRCFRALDDFHLPYWVCLRVVVLLMFDVSYPLLGGCVRVFDVG